MTRTFISNQRGFILKFNAIKFLKITELVSLE